MFIKCIARLVGLLQKFEIRFITYLLFIDFNFIIPKGTFFFQKIKSKNNYLGYFEKFKNFTYSDLSRLFSFKIHF